MGSGLAEAKAACAKRREAQKATCIWEELWEGPECGKDAPYRRKNFRWGDASKGEPSIVNLTLRYCEEHVRLYDEEH